MRLSTYFKNCNHFKPSLFSINKTKKKEYCSNFMPGITSGGEGGGGGIKFLAGIVVGAYSRLALIPEWR